MEAEFERLDVHHDGELDVKEFNAIANEIAFIRRQVPS
jgi:hypothetical protein